jgi:trehalose-6-phosphatase
MRILRDIPRSVSFLDYDGTLCPHIEVWENLSYNPQGIYESMQNLHRKSLGVWWNTGRRIESLKSVNEKFLNFPGFFVQGSVHWDTKQALGLGEALPDDLAGKLFDRIKNETQYKLEIKPTAARIATIRRIQKKYLKKFVDSLEVPLPPEWEWRIGDRGAELLLKKCSKGTAIKYAFEKGLVPQDAIPIVAGDDFFDRGAMEYALSRGGYAIMLGEGCGWITEIPHRASQVVFFREPHDFLQFLKSV